jgi:hypothetical protein
MDKNAIGFVALKGHWHFTNCSINGVNSMDSLQIYLPDYSFKIVQSPWNSQQPLILPFIGDKPYADYLDPNYPVVYNSYTMGNNLVPDYTFNIAFDDVSGFYRLQKKSSKSPMFYRSNLDTNGYLANPFQTPFQFGACNLNKILVNILSENEILITTSVNFNFKLWAEKL